MVVSRLGTAALALAADLALGLAVDTFDEGGRLAGSSMDEDAAAIAMSVMPLSTTGSTETLWSRRPCASYLQ